MVFHCELSDRSLMHYFNDGALSKKYSVKHLHSAKFPLREVFLAQVFSGYLQENNDLIHMSCLKMKCLPYTFHHLSSPLGSSLTFHKEPFYCIC